MVLLPEVFVVVIVDAIGFARVCVIMNRDLPTTFVRLWATTILCLAMFIVPGVSSIRTSQIAIAIALGMRATIAPPCLTHLRLTQVRIAHIGAVHTAVHRSSTTTSYGN